MKVNYPDLSDDFQIAWSLEKLEGRMVDMQEMCNLLEFGGDQNDNGIDYDPFIDDLDNFTHADHLIGNAYCYLDTVYYLAPLEEDQMAIIDDHGANKGSLKVSLIPNIEGVNMEEFEHLKELLGKELILNVKIFEAAGIPENFSTKVFCKYAIAQLNNEEFRSKPIEDSTTNPKFDFFNTHKFIITPEIADDFLNRALTISVYGDISQVKKEREMKKLKDNVNSSVNKSVTSKLSLKNKEADSNLSNFMNSEDPAPSMPIIFSGGANVEQLKYELDTKEQQLQKIKAEQLKREAEYNKRIKELEEREQKLGIPSGSRGSSCCITF